MTVSEKTLLRVLAVLCSLTLVASAQDFAKATAANAKQFAGRWKASFQGHPFLTVVLTIDGNKLTGTVSHVDIDVDKNGELTRADPSEGQDSIAELRVAGDTLRITVKSEDDAIRSEMHLTSADAADFRIVVPPDVPAPKPWRLQRASAP